MPSDQPTRLSYRAALDAAGTYQLVGRCHPGECARSRLLEGFEVPVSPLFGEA